MRQSRYPGLIIAMAGVGAAFIVAIGTGYRLSGQRAPAEISSTYAGAILVLAFAIGAGVYAYWPRGKARVALQKLAGSEDLRSWDAERRAYDANVNAVATCVHLQPIERAMRAARIATRFEIPLRISATCVVDDRRLAEEFTLPPSTRYIESMSDARSEFDPPYARISCDICQSLIDVLSQDQARTTTPTFPG